MSRPAVASAILTLVTLAARGRAAPPPPARPTDPHTAALEREAHALEARVAAHPEDVDARMALAAHLAWLGRRADARRQALEVTTRAPSYADAYELLARLAAWDHDYVQARRWLDELATHHPLDTAQQLLRADIFLWEGRLDQANAVLDAMPDQQASAVLRRRAQLAYLAGDYRHAHELAGQLLADAPDDARARGMYDDTRHVLVGIDAYVGRYPVADPDQQLAAGVMPTVVVFPGDKWSVTAQYELDRRFATYNHRVALRVDFRPRPAWTATVFARSGWVHVVPQTTAYARARWEPRTGDYVGLRYQLDVMRWPGQLHRAILEAGLVLGRGFRLDVGGSVGGFDYCGDWQAVTTYEAQLGYVRQRWQVGLKYARGSELDRPVLSAFLAGKYGEDACPADLGSDAAMLDLESIQSDAFSLLPMVQLDRRSSLGLGYTYERRFDGSAVHTGTVALRRTF